jgi:hypothetical protein
MNELAQRAVASPHWRWMPGMLVRYPTGYSERIEDDTDAAARLEDDGFPDLTDPATLGCLLALVREAWEPHRGSDYIASTMHTGSGWGVGARYGSEGLAAIVLPTYDTEAAALVAALEAAP